MPVEPDELLVEEGTPVPQVSRARWGLRPKNRNPVTPRATQSTGAVAPAAIKKLCTWQRWFFCVFDFSLVGCRGSICRFSRLPGQFRFCFSMRGPSRKAAIAPAVPAHQLEFMTTAHR